MIGEKVSVGRRTTQLAAEHPDKPAIIFIPQEGDERVVSWHELHETSTRLAHLMQGLGVGQGSMIVIGLPNCPEHYFATIAAWKLGATVLPVSHRAPPVERDAILDLAAPVLVVADWGGTAFPTIASGDFGRAASHPADLLPDRVPDPGRAMGSGGSTGRPKIILNPGAWEWEPGFFTEGPGTLGMMKAGQIQLVAGPLYHNSPFGWSHHGLFEDHTLVLFERFDAARVVDAIERHRINFGFLSPTMMQRIAVLPDIKRRDLSSVEAIFHTAAPCPEWVKRAWIDLIGAERVWEGFGSTEAVGAFLIRGDEWLEHPGTVGRPVSCEVRILDPAGRELPAGEIGEIFTRPIGMDEPPYSYIGSPPARSTPDGFMSVGDLGFMDEGGFLHPVDRRVDMIITGGENVFPAEVEAALSSHPDVQDVAVIGVPDEQWGRRVHAIVQARDPDNPPSVEELDRYARERLMPYKVPKTFEFVEEFPRDPSGKLRRSKLVADRTPEVSP
jgi:bile acid-coenzyme A ligase